MAGDLLYFLHRHFRAFASGTLAFTVVGLGLILSSLLKA